MKFNFKKIASVLAATIMLGSTVSFAAAAWPAPFVANGSSASAIVYGASAPTTGGDKAAAINLGAELDKGVTTIVSAGSSGTGDSVQLVKSADKFNLQDTMNSFLTTLDSEDLSKVLTDGVYLNDDNNDYDYEQTIVLGANQLTFDKNKDYNSDKPQVGFYLNKGDLIMNYTLDFTDSAECGTTNDMIACDNTDIEMLGKNFFISNAENTSTGVKLTLLDSANLATVSEGETKTITVGDKTYEVSIDYVASPTAGDETKLTVNGITTNTLNEGETYKLPDGTFVGIKDISYNAKESGISKVQFSLGMGKLVLNNGDEVQLNDKDISTLVDANGVSSVISATIATSNGGLDLESITLSWTLDSDAVIAAGSDLLMPGFNAVKVSMGAFTAPKQETATLENSADSIVLTADIKDGTLELPVLYGNASEFLSLGEDADNVLITNNSVGSTTAGIQILLNTSALDSSSFVVTYIKGDEAETYAYELGSIVRSTNETTLKNLVTGGKNVVLKEVADTAEVGNVEFTLSNVDGVDQDWAIIDLKSTVSGGNVYADRIVTKEGLEIKLPVIAYNNNTATNDGLIQMKGITLNASGGTAIPNANVASWKMNFTEENNDGDIASGKSFTLTSTVGSDGPEVTATSLTTIDEEKNSDWSVALSPSDLATKVRIYSPSGSSTALGKAEVIYAGEESTADVYVSETSATVGAVKDSVKVVTDAEVDSVKSKNLIVVGGSCINTVAASMLGSTSPICGDSWATKTGAGAGKYLIQVAASPVNAEKIAMLIAGYETADTQNAVAKVKEGAVSTDVGTKLVGPVAA